MNISLNASGGGANFSYLFGVMSTFFEYHTKNGDHITKLTGNSSGTLAALLCATNNIEKGKELILKKKFSAKIVFNKVPVSEKGKFTLNSLKHLLTFGAFGKQENLKNLIKEIVTEKDFKQYVSDQNTPDLYVGVVDLFLGSSEFISIKNLNYNTMIKVVMASTSIFPFVVPIRIGNSWYVDGGYIDHIGSAFLYEHFGKEIDVGYSIYSRDKKINCQKFYWKEYFSYIEIIKGRPLKQFFEVFFRILAIMIFNISKDDEKLAESYARLHKIKEFVLYQPREKRLWAYEFNDKKMKDIYHYAVKQTKNLLNYEC